MAMNLDAVLKIAAKVTGLQDLGALEKGIQGAEKAATAAAGGFKAMVSSAAWQAAAAAAAGLSVALGLSVKAAMDFEESLAGVRKVVDGLESPAALKEIKQEILDLSSKMPIAAKGFADIYAAAGASGIAKAELKDFATLVARVATAFDMTAADAGRSLAQLRVSLGLSTEEVATLADTMNYLDNNTGASAAQLVEFMTRSGSVGKMAGLAGEQTAGFGAAMIQAGVQTEVAATSFNNMIKALSKGPSMTDRQVDALRRLGYSVISASDEERRLTFAVEAESEKRMETYRRETDVLLKEVNRRYRNQLQMLQDGWDDEARAFERGLQKQADARIKAIQDDQTMSEEAKDAAIDRIREQMEDELTIYRRSQRDRQQVQRDRLDDEKEAEVEGINAKYKEVEKVEKARVEAAKVQAKKSAEDTANAWKQSFADRMQKDAIGTIMEVLKKISNLPKSQQVSVISDLFGDEARGLAPLIANIGELDRVLALSNDKTKAAGSVLKEYAARMSTTAAQAQVARNNMENFSIVMGDSFLPAITKVVQILGPLLKGFTWMVDNIPGLGPALGGIAFAFTAMVGAAPFISGFIMLLGQLKPLAIVIGTFWAGLKTVFIVAFSGILSWLGGTFIPGLLAFFGAISPVGWVVIAIAGITLLVVAFREQLGQFLAWLWEWGKPIREFWVGLWNGITELATAAFEGLMQIAYTLWVQPLVELWNNVLREPVAAFWNWLQEKAQEAWDGVTGIWTRITEWWNTNVATPISTLWNELVNGIQKAMDDAGKFIRGVWDGIIGYIKNAFNGLMKGLETLLNGAVSAVNKLIKGFNNIQVVADIPLVPTLSLPRLAKGGHVTGPTLALIGEGGEPEYVIPESKMGRASQRYLAGARGGNVIPMAAGGYVGQPSAGMYAAQDRHAQLMEINNKLMEDLRQATEDYYAKSAEMNKQRFDAMMAASKRDPEITVQTGPVVEIDGSRFVLMEDYMDGLRAAHDAAVASTLQLLGETSVSADLGSNTSVSADLGGNNWSRSWRINSFNNTPFAGNWRMAAVNNRPFGAG